MSSEKAYNEAKKRAMEANDLLEVFEEAKRIETESKQNDRLLKMKKDELKVVSDEVTALADKREAKKKAMLSLDKKVDEANTELLRLTKELEKKQSEKASTEASLKKALASVTP